VIENNLGTVILSVRQYWYERSLRYVEHSDDEKLDIADWELLQRGYLHKKVAYTKYAYGCDIHRSPWVVPEVQNIIKSARVQRRDRKKSYLNKTPISYLNRLPLGICLLVLEVICPPDFTQCDVQDTRSLLSVFALDAPESFWRSRLQNNRDLFFELDRVRNHDSLDWQYVWLGFMDLLVDHTWFISSGLATRKRALRSIKPSASNFEKLRCVKGRC
jgi:hypothetical protein